MYQCGQLLETPRRAVQPAKEVAVAAFRLVTGHDFQAHPHKFGANTDQCPLCKY